MKEEFQFTNIFCRLQSAKSDVCHAVIPALYNVATRFVISDFFAGAEAEELCTVICPCITISIISNHHPG